jgi:hypothetical protein
MNWRDLIKGSGGRRRTPESWDKLMRELSAAQVIVRQMEDAVACECPTGKHPRYWVSHPGLTACPWCIIDQERAQWKASVAPPGAEDPGMSVPAPADVPGGCFAGLDHSVPPVEAALRIVADTPGVRQVVPIASVSADTQATDVRTLWEALGLSAAAGQPVAPSSAANLEPAHVALPPVPPHPPLVPEPPPEPLYPPSAGPLSDPVQLVDWGRKPAEPEAVTQFLLVSAMRRVEFAKTG